MRFALFLLAITPSFGATVTASVSAMGTILDVSQSVPFNITVPGISAPNSSVISNPATLTFVGGGIFAPCQPVDSTLPYLCSGSLSLTAAVALPNGSYLVDTGISGSYTNLGNIVDPFADCPRPNAFGRFPTCNLALPVGTYLLTVKLFNELFPTSNATVPPFKDSLTATISGVGVAAVPEPATGLVMLFSLLLLPIVRPLVFGAPGISTTS
jgi:hypothetical protein